MQIRSLFTSLALAGAVSAQCLMDVNNPGTNLSLTDDSVRTVILGFNFPFNGTNYDRITVCSNGFVWFGLPPALNAAEFTDSEASFLSNAPRVALCWDDWNPGVAAAGDGVFFYSNGFQASVTWKAVPHYGAPAVFANMQLQLDIAGNILVNYAATMSLPNSTSIVGVTAGNGAAANQLDLSTLPVIAATGYELFPANVLDLIGTTQFWNATTPISYTPSVVTPGLCSASPPFPSFATNTTYGTGCPAPSSPGSAATGTFYELFASGASDLVNTSILFVPTGANTYVATAGPGMDLSFGPGDALVQGDDTQVVVSTTSMGSFPYRGASLTSIAACSNGYLWMGVNTLNDYTPTAAEFATQTARIAPAWHDWNFGTTTAPTGTFYWTATPTFCMATWQNVAAFGVAATQNTFQCKLLATGEIIFSYGTHLNNSTTGGGMLTGLSGGGSAVATTAIDISTVLTTPAIANITPVPPIVPLAHGALTLPQLGATYTVQTTSVPAGAVIGAIVVGVNNPNIDLTFLGMTGCTQYASQDFVSVQFISGPAITLNLALPWNMAFAGINLFSQGAVFAPLNPFGVIASNGVQGVVGL